MYDQTDARGVPVSSGIPPLVRVSIVIGILVIFTVAGMVLSVSAFGHVWPASNSTHLPL